jgi:hypothetical protein
MIQRAAYRGMDQQGRLSSFRQDSAVQKSARDRMCA